MNSWRHYAFYRFVTLAGEVSPARLRPWIFERAREANLCGSVILAPEGINGFLAGPEADLAKFAAELVTWEPFRDLAFKKSTASGRPFRRLKVKIKAEIIPMRRPEIRPELQTGQRIRPRELKKWLDEGRAVRLVDTRNSYEVEVGTFVTAEHLGIQKFQDFADALNGWVHPPSDVPIVMFCTGGIRCEKATALALQQGLANVHQLDGGILGYFEACGGAHYRGECFVFDERERQAAEPAEVTSS